LHTDAFYRRRMDMHPRRYTTTATKAVIGTGVAFMVVCCNYDQWHGARPVFGEGVVRWMANVAGVETRSERADHRARGWHEPVARPTPTPRGRGRPRRTVTFATQKKRPDGEEEPAEVVDPALESAVVFQDGQVTEEEAEEPPPEVVAKIEAEQKLNKAKHAKKELQECFGFNDDDEMEYEYSGLGSSKYHR